MARPSKLTLAVEIGIADLVRQGVHPAVAARQMGVADSTYRTWLRSDGARYERFRRAIEQAEAEAETESVAATRAADPRWWLERRHRDRWGRPAESGAQAAAIVQVAGPAAGTEDPFIHFTAEEWRIASRAHFNQQRVERGEPPLLGGPYGGLDELVVEDLAPDRPGDDYD